MFRTRLAYSLIFSLPLLSPIPLAAPELLTTADQQITLPIGAAAPVIELTYVGGFIDSDDRIRTRVFVEGDANAPRYVLESYRPAYMKDAGTFRSEISEDAFNRLLQSFGNEGVLALPEADLNAQVRAQATTQPGIVEADTHNASVQVDFRLGSRGTLSQPDLRSLKMQTRSLQDFARSDTVAPRNIANGVLALEGLVRSTDLERIE